MSLKEVMLDTESDKGRQFYTKMLNWLDDPKRKLFDNPQRLVTAAGIKAGDTVLEIGCGSGFFTAAVCQIVGSNGHVYATDIHDIAIVKTQEKIDRLGLQNVTIQKDDAMQSAFADSKFDVVLLYGVVPAPVISMEDISQEIYRLLKPGGIYAIWTKAPFWTPYQRIGTRSFHRLPKKHGVFRLQKSEEG